MTSSGGWCDARTRPEASRTPAGNRGQQAALTVDEAGTRAAAVTEIGVMAGSAPMEPPHELVLDRPYLMAIEDGSTGWSLVLAAVLDTRG